MKLLFVSSSPIAFNVETPQREPLGGTESAIAYLAPQLVRQGHDVTILATLPPGTPAHIADVRHVEFNTVTEAFFNAGNFDIVVTVSMPNNARMLRDLAPRALHFAWLQGFADQPDMSQLNTMGNVIDCVVFVSQTQRDATGFPGNSHVIGNGIAPVFEGLFTSPEDLMAAKENRGAYTSTPFRGLEVLADAMTRTQGETVVDIYSGMRLYQSSEARYGALYERLKASPKCEYRAAVGQATLANGLRRTAFLAYPNIFAETYCISAVEAVAAGLKVVTTELGALPETTFGYGDYIPYSSDMNDLATRFAVKLDEVEKTFLADRQAWAEERFAQSQAVAGRCNWRARADEWEALFRMAGTMRRPG